MFYFHQYMSVALEGLFAWVVTRAAEAGVAGVSFTELSAALDSAGVRKALSELLETGIGSPFGQSTPKDTIRLFDAAFDTLNMKSSAAFDEVVTLESPLSEDRLEQVIRDGTCLHHAAGLAVPMLLLAVTLVRYQRWEETGYGQWLANATRDPYLDLLPSGVSAGLRRRFGSWWDCPWSTLAEYVLARYVVQQHQSLSYEKTVEGERCLLQVDGQCVMSNAAYDTVGIGNPRFRSALRVLKDLWLLQDLDDDLVAPTDDGLAVLEESLAGVDPA